MTEAEWLACSDPEPMLRCAERRSPDELSGRKLALIIVGWGGRIKQTARGGLMTRAFQLLELWAENRLDHYLTMEARHLATTSGSSLDQLTARRVLGIMLPDIHDPWCDSPVSKVVYLANLVSSHLPRREQVRIIRDVLQNPFRCITFSPQWRTDTAIALARQMYESREFGAMPILADALQDAGCDNEDILSHCRGEGPHVRGCWVVDLLLGKE
jgi:hypothetical protein